MIADIETKSFKAFGTYPLESESINSGCSIKVDGKSRGFTSSLFGSTKVVLSVVVDKRN
jgi:hypothetical protein